MVGKWRHSAWEGSITSARFNFQKVELKGSYLSSSQAERFWGFFLPFWQCDSTYTILAPLVSEKSHHFHILLSLFPFPNARRGAWCYRSRMLSQDRLCERGVRSNLRALHFVIDFRKCPSHSQTWPWQLIIRFNCPQEIHLKFKALPVVARDKLYLIYQSSRTRLSQT